MTSQRLFHDCFRAIGVEHRVLCTDRGALQPAVQIARQYLDQLDGALSRFRPDSEVSRLAAMTTHSDPREVRRGAIGTVTMQISALFAEHLQAALTASRLTGGLVDPTVGRALIATGYDADMDVVRTRDAAPARTLTQRDGGAVVVVHQRRPLVTADADRAEVPGWRQIDLDDERNLTVPTGCVIDLGATAKSYAADVIAARLADSLPGGFLVNLGGDISVSGRLPEEGWQIGVETADGKVRQSITSRGQAVATSSTQLRRWTASGRQRHHIIDPRTGMTAETVWAQVTCAAASALEANAASTAAIVLGRRAPDWLSAVAVPSRLDGVDGEVLVTPGWPQP